MHGMEHLERLWLWILPSPFPHIFCWPFEGCWVLSTGSAPQDVAVVGTVSSLSQGVALCPTTRQAINFLLLVTITQRLFKNNPH